MNECIYKFFPYPNVSNAMIPSNKQTLDTVIPMYENISRAKFSSGGILKKKQNDKDNNNIAYLSNRIL